MVADRSGSSGCGWGWTLQRDFQDARPSHHSGGGGRVKVEALIQPTQNLAVTALTNAGDPEADQAVGQAASAQTVQRLKLAADTSRDKQWHNPTLQPAMGSCRFQWLAFPGPIFYVLLPVAAECPRHVDYGRRSLEIESLRTEPGT